MVVAAKSGFQQVFDAYARRLGYTQRQPLTFYFNDQPIHGSANILDIFGNQNIRRGFAIIEAVLPEEDKMLKACAAFRLLAATSDPAALPMEKTTFLRSLVAT